MPLHPTKTIRQKVLVPAPPDRVYEAFIKSQIHAAFTGSAATGRGRVGSRFTAWDGYILGKHLKLEKGKRILQEWSTTLWHQGLPPSILDLRLRAKGKGTELTMIHSRVPADQATSYASGWKDCYWTPLRKYFLHK